MIFFCETLYLNYIYHSLFSLSTTFFPVFPSLVIAHNSQFSIYSKLTNVFYFFLYFFPSGLFFSCFDDIIVSNNVSAK